VAGETGTLIRRYRRLNARKLFVLVALFAIMIGFALVGLTQGSANLGWKGAIESLWRNTGDAHAIIWNLRLPRIAMAVVAGWGLALAGTVFQAILRNPLASPYTLGIASSAGFGAVAAIVTGTGFYNEYVIAGNAFLCALFSSFLILGVARMKGSTTETLVLAGIAIMFLFSSLSSLFQYMGTKEEVHAIVFWFFGSLSKVGWKEIGMASAMVFVPCPFIYRMSLDFNLLAVDDESAVSMGVNIGKTRIVALVLASLITAGAICFIGVIGFIGLVSPHIARMIVGGDHRYLFPTAALLGSSLVLAADTVGRTLWAPQVIPIGIVTSFIGVPFLFYLLMRRRKEYW
jgi:iron complex transport system permease protein